MQVNPVQNPPLPVSRLAFQAQIFSARKESATLIGCTGLRAVSGILRTQRGRRGSGRVRLRAGTASAGPVLCGRARPPPLPSHSASIPAPAAQLFAASPHAPAPLRMLSWPSWRPARAGLLEARPRAVSELVGTVRVSHSSRSSNSLASSPTLLATSSGQWPAHLRQILADSDAGPGSRNSRPPRPEVTIRHVPIPSPLLALARSRSPDSSRATITARAH
jgi:hypothetical protein